MIIPIWAVLGFGAALFAAMLMLAQEHIKASGFAMAFWNKAFNILILFIPALYFGFPTQPHFYAYMAINSIVYAISDVIFFNVVSKTGAGTLSRLMPLNIILVFLLWLAVDPALQDKYLADPYRSIAIFLTIAMTGYFGFMMKKCEFSWGVLKSAWFVIVAGIIGNIVVKKAMEGVDPLQGSVAAITVSAAMMVTMWSGYYMIKKPVPWQEMVSKKTLKSGLIIACITSVMVTCLLSSITLAENPAYTSAIFHLSAVLILIYYRFKGIKEQSNVFAGMGIVFCALALIILKSI